MASLLAVSDIGCGSTSESETPSVSEESAAVPDTTVETATGSEADVEEAHTLSPEELTAMGVQTFSSVDELKTALGHNVISLADSWGYEATDISADGATATITYHNGSDANSPVVVLTTAPKEVLDLSDRESIGDILVSDTFVNLYEEDESMHKCAWWSDGAYTYLIDAFYLDSADVQKLLTECVEDTEAHPDGN